MKNVHCNRDFILFFFILLTVVCKCIPGTHFNVFSRCCCWLSSLRSADHNDYWSVYLFYKKEKKLCNSYSVHICACTSAVEPYKMSQPRRTWSQPIEKSLISGPSKLRKGSCPIASKTLVSNSTVLQSLAPSNSRLLGVNLKTLMSWFRCVQLGLEQKCAGLRPPI